MFWCLFLIPILFLCFLSVNDVTVTFIKDKDTKLYLTLFKKKINLIKKRKNKNNSAASQKSKKKPPTLKLIKLILKNLDKCEVEIKKIALPLSTDNSPIKNFLLPYRLSIPVYTTISYLESKTKSFKISNDAFRFNDSSDVFCLDINLRIKLFYVLLILFDYLILSSKAKIKR